MKPTVYLWLHAIALLGVAGAGFFIQQWASVQHVALYAKQADLLKSPQEDSTLTLAEADLVKHKPALDELDSVLINRDDLVQVVGAIQTKAASNGVEATVPTVSEHVELDANGLPKAVAGSLLPVQLDITASGPPAHLLQFMHDIEYLPYLIRLNGMKLHTTTEAAQSTLAAQAPDGGKAVAVVTGHLEAQFIISILAPPLPSANSSL